MQTSRGFTLIELLVVVAIVAILATIAVPAFTEQMRKSRRSEAFQVLGDLQLKQERWRSNRAAYTATLSDLGFGSATLPSGYYVVSLAAPAPSPCPTAGTPATTAANSYQITATASGAQASDARCATIVLSNRCGVIEKSSTPAGNICW
jgi:type IV pilus assembly protein PilE